MEIPPEKLREREFVRNRLLAAKPNGNGKAPGERSSWQALASAVKTIDNPLSFTFADLVVHAWLKNTHLFGMDGFKNDYPCSRKVAVLLYGANGLLAKGILSRNRDGSFRKT